MLSDSKRLAYLLNVVFGDYLSDPVLAAVNTAYLDLSRTQHGFSKETDKNAIQERRVNYLVERISFLVKNTFNCQKDFDTYHKETTKKLISLSQIGFTVGQGQKWINMSLKYCLVIDPQQYSKNCIYFHVPIDNIILGKLTGFPSIGTWSRLASYDRYIDFQDWFRDTYPRKAPILSELELWSRK